MLTFVTLGGSPIRSLDMAGLTGEPQDVGEVLGTEHIMLRWLSSSELSPDRYHFFASETGNARKGPPVIFQLSLFSLL